MKFLTLLGKMIVLIPSTIASIVAFIFINSKDSGILLTSAHSGFIRALDSIVMSALVGMTVTLVISLAIVFSARTHTSEFRTIYSNDRDIEVYVRTYQEENIFAGDYLPHKIVSTSGTLKMKKNGAHISQSIDKIEFVGLNQKDSKVKKIEYAETLYGESLFGLQLLNNVKSTRLKIHLEDSIPKEDLETEEELRSFLYGN